ncbi:hypothetical protein EZS27_037944 [termite gut metagenome]|uniref:Uncharacterized protein n=1 Tax=termite gut metagenome TaxID=433724 RepID=A0A5J4PQG3_9ZZZZ
MDGREKSELYEVYEAVIKELDFPLLQTFLPNAVRFRREQNIEHKPLFLSTLLPIPLFTLYSIILLIMK